MSPGQPTPSPTDEPTPLPQPPTPSPEPRPTQVPIPAMQTCGWAMADRGNLSDIQNYWLADCKPTIAICAKHLQRLRGEKVLTRRILDRAATALFDSALVLTNGRARAMIGKPLRPSNDSERRDA